MIMMIIYRYNQSHPINFSIKTHAEELCTQTWRSIYIAAFIFTYVSSHRSRPRLIQALKQNYGNFVNIPSQYHLPSQKKNMISHHQSNIHKGTMSHWLPYHLAVRGIMQTVILFPWIFWQTSRFRGALPNGQQQQHPKAAVFLPIRAQVQANPHLST